MPLGRWSVSLWLGLGLAALACRSNDERAVSFSPPRIDLGVVVQNEPVRAEVQILNRGGSAVSLRAAPSSGRCLWPGMPKAIAGRHTAHVHAICQSDLLGPLEESLTVLDAAQGTVLATLPIVGKIEPAIGFDTAYVDLRPEFGQTSSIDVHLTGKDAATSSARVASTGGDTVTADAIVADAGHVEGFRLSCKGQAVGMHAGSLVVHTGLAVQPTLTLSWGCRVPATLEVEPSNPYFNLRSSGDRATQIVVRSRQPGFRVSSARIVEGPFHATLERPNSDGSRTITVRVRNDAIPDEARAATGKLLIESNDEREPRREVPLFGFGKVNKAAAPETN